MIINNVSVNTKLDVDFDNENVIHIGKRFKVFNTANCCENSNYYTRLKNIDFISHDAREYDAIPGFD